MFLRLSPKALNCGASGSCQHFPGRGWAPEHQFPPAPWGGWLWATEGSRAPQVSSLNHLQNMSLSLPVRFLGDVARPEWQWTFRQPKWKRLLAYPNRSVFHKSLLSLWMTPIAGKQTCKPHSASVLQPQTHSGALLLHAGAGCAPWEHNRPLHDAAGSDGDGGGQEWKGLLQVFWSLSSPSMGCCICSLETPRQSSWKCWYPVCHR